MTIHVVRLLVSAGALMVLATAASAQTQPFSFSVESFSVPERGVFDGFDDGLIDPAWSDPITGTVVESGSTLTLSNPGATGFLPAPLVSEVSGISGRGLQLDFGGSFTATSIWTQQVPNLGEGVNLSLGSLNSSTNHVHQLSIGISNTLPAVASVLGGGAGLGVSVLSVVRDSQAGNILSVSRTTIPVLAAEITGDVHLALSFDDVANTLQPLYSLDGGAMLLSAGGPIDWDFLGGGFALTASSTVPEPGAAMLLGLGLVGMSSWGRSRPRS